MKNKIIILSILFTTNNVLYSLTTLDGKVIFWTTSGCKKSKGVKKIAQISVLTAAKDIIKHSVNFGYKQTYLKVKGFNKNKKLVIKYISQSLLNVILVSDETSFPHNGCRKPKNKRI